MKMKNAMLFTVALSISGIITGNANAQTVTKTNYSGSNGTLVNFDSPLPNGFSLSGGTVTSGSTVTQAQPLGSTGKYLITGEAVGPATLRSSTGFDGVSFLWGTASNDNQASFFDTLGNLIGSTTGAAVGPYNSESYITYTLDPNSGKKLGSVQLSSNTFSFEADNFTFFNNGAGSPTPVPEPATLGLFGLGMAALATRYRRRRAANA